MQSAGHVQRMDNCNIPEKEYCGRREAIVAETS